jgi:hypothetical protein
MSTTTDGNGNGDHRNGKRATIASMGNTIIKVLPPAMLLLVLLNIIFLGVAAYVFQHNTEVRNQMIQRIIESCLPSR